jgi:hypothetical protein
VLRLCGVDRLVIFAEAEVRPGELEVGGAVVWVFGDLGLAEFLEVSPVSGLEAVLEDALVVCALLDPLVGRELDDLGERRLLVEPVEVVPVGEAGVQGALQVGDCGSGASLDGVAAREAVEPLLDPETEADLLGECAGGAGGVAEAEVRETEAVVDPAELLIIELVIGCEQLVAGAQGFLEAVVLERLDDAGVAS